MQKSMGNGDNKPPEFFEGLKNKFKEQMVEMGMDPIDVEDFLDEKGLVEINAELVIDHMKNPTYVNPLKRNLVRQEAPQFDYYNPSNPSI
mmetsp:Transcript_16460/g.11629  ORF Transcript_16460/g.11629 Transcript_16460/m.11629 type:complete len:90 (-) Transcript_16460:512-781(-)